MDKLAAPKLAANWVMGELAGALNRDGLEITARAGFRPCSSRACSGASPTRRFPARSPRKCSRRCGARRQDADKIIESRGLKQITDTSAIERAIDQVIAANPGATRRLPRRQGKAVRLLRRPGDEGNGRQGQSGPAQRAAQAEIEVTETDDRIRRFLFERAPVRGHMVHLDSAWTRSGSITTIRRRFARCWAKRSRRPR